MPKGFGKFFEHPGVNKSKEEESEDFVEIEESDAEPLELLEPLPSEELETEKRGKEYVPKPRFKQKDLPFDERESYQKVAAFGYKKGLKNGKINVLPDGSYILEFLDKKGERTEIYYFDKKGNLAEFKDSEFGRRELEEITDKTKKNFEKINDELIRMIEEDSVYSKIIKH